MRCCDYCNDEIRIVDSMNLVEFSPTQTLIFCNGCCLAGFKNEYYCNSTTYDLDDIIDEMLLGVQNA